MTSQPRLSTGVQTCSSGTKEPTAEVPAAVVRLEGGDRVEPAGPRVGRRERVAHRSGRGLFWEWNSHVRQRDHGVVLRESWEYPGREDPLAVGPLGDVAAVGLLAAARRGVAAVPVMVAARVVVVLVVVQVARVAGALGRAQCWRANLQMWIGLWVKVVAPISTHGG